MTLISIMTPCYNEQDNVYEVYTRVKAEFARLSEYRYEHIFIDNASSDQTLEKLSAIAANDPNVKVIVNTRNFGHIRSPHHALLQASGQAVISIVADLQDPPELIPLFLEKWQQGFKVVVGIKPSAEENALMSAFRRMCYKLFSRLTPIKQIHNFTGFGLYDQKVIALLRQFDDPYPYFRGMIADMGFDVCEIPYHQPKRSQGFTKNNFYTLYDLAMLALTSYSKAPMRIATLLGFALATFSFLLSVVFLVLKLCYWDSFALGIAPMLIGIFFFSSVQLFFMGLLGEYIVSINTYVQKRPLVIEKQRINFD